jgi:hypothetical protein
MHILAGREPSAMATRRGASGSAHSTKFSNPARVNRDKYRIPSVCTNMLSDGTPGANSIAPAAFNVSQNSSQACPFCTRRRFKEPSSSSSFSAPVVSAENILGRTWNLQNEIIDRYVLRMKRRIRCAKIETGGAMINVMVSLNKFTVKDLFV